MAQKQLQQFYNRVTKLFVLESSQPQQQALEIEAFVQTMLKASCTMDNIKAILNQQAEFDVLEQIRQLKLLKENVSKLKQQSEDQDSARLTRLAQENVQLGKIIKDLRTNTDQTFYDLASAKQQVSDLKDELEKARKQISGNSQDKLENERLQQTVEQLNKRIDYLSAELQGSQQLAKNESDKAQALSTQLRRANESAQETLKLYSDGQRENQKLKQIVDNMRYELDSEKAHYYAELDAAGKQRGLQTSDVYKLTQLNGNLAKYLENTQTELKKAQDDKQDVQLFAKYVYQEAHTMQVEIEALRLENTELTQKEQRLQSQLETTAKHVVDYQSGEADELKRRNIEYDDEIKALKSRLSGLKAKIAASASDRGVPIADYESKCQEVEEANDDLAALMAQYKQSEDALAQAKVSVAQKDKQIADLKEVIGVLEEQLAESKQMLNYRLA